MKLGRFVAGTVVRNYVYLGFEGEHRGLAGVLLGEHHVDEEGAAGVGAAGGAVDDHVEAVRVGRRRRAGTAVCRRLDPQLGELVPFFRAAATPLARDVAAPDVALHVLLGDEQALTEGARDSFPYLSSSRDRGPGDGRWPLAAPASAGGGSDHSGAIELMERLHRPWVPWGLFP